jgi:acetyltransferase-like isoleucine patch superfamily enzyme
VFTLLLSSELKAIGRGTRISPPFRFCNLRQISLGKGVIVSRDCWFVALNNGENGDGPKLIIDSHAGIGMGATISAARRVEIGEFVLLARNVYISDHGHGFEDVSVPVMHQGITEPKPVKIGRHSWLGQNVCVLPGVSIGQHCIIGANSVVLSDVPDYSVAVGSPARVIKTHNKTTNRWERV